MKFEYTGRHIDVTPAIRSHVEEHFAKLDHLFDENHSKAHVIIEVQRGRHRAEVIVNYMNEVLTAETTLADMYQSLSRTIDKIEKQARRLKTKIIDKSHRAKKTGVVAPDLTPVEPAPNTPRIINVRRYAVKPMTAEEAAMLLDDEENQFLVFRNSENERISVIYKRKDGNYGLIQP